MLRLVASLEATGPLLKFALGSFAVGKVWRYFRCGLIFRRPMTAIESSIGLELSQSSWEIRICHMMRLILLECLYINKLINIYIYMVVVFLKCTSLSAKVSLLICQV